MNGKVMVRIAKVKLMQLICTRMQRSQFASTLWLSPSSRFHKQTISMDRLHYGQNFEKSLNRKIYYHSIEEHPKISKIAEFGCETL